MKALARILPTLTLLFASGHGSAEVIYSGLKDLSIPTTYAGTYIDVDGGLAPSASAFTGWDFNPYMGGVYVANNTAFQPGRTAANGMGNLQNFAVNSTIDASLLLGSGMGGSINHLGSTFTAGTEGYLGFKLNDANYGWMRVVFTNNTGGALIKDWAYDTSGAAIATGNVLQSGSTVTLNSALGSFTLGSQVGGSNSVVKTGANSTTLTGSNTYTGTTTVSGGTLAINGDLSAANGNVVVSTALTRLIGTGTVGGDTTINSGAILSAGGELANSNKVGKLTFDETASATTDLTYGAGSIFEWDLNANKDTNGYDHDSDGGTPNTHIGARGTDYDAVDVSGTLTVDSGAIFRVVLGSSVGTDGTFWQQTQTWTDIFGGGFTPSGTGFNNALLQVFNTAGAAYDQSTLNPGYGFTISGTTLTWTAVPEPTSALVGLLIGAGLLRRRRLA